MSRNNAEKLLMNAQREPGLFLLRASMQKPGYVLSLIFEGRVVHYQIRQESSPENEAYLTFDTDTGAAPRFRSLSSVLHHLFRNPAHLPVPLSRWLERNDDLIPPAPAPRHSLQTPQAKAKPKPSDGAPALPGELEIAVPPEEELPRKTSEGSDPRYITPVVRCQAGLNPRGEIGTLWNIISTISHASENTSLSLSLSLCPLMPTEPRRRRQPSLEPTPTRHRHVGSCHFCP